MVTPFSCEGDIEVQVLLGWLWSMDIFSADPRLSQSPACTAHWNRWYVFSQASCNSDRSHQTTEVRSIIFRIQKPHT